MIRLLTENFVLRDLFPTDLENIHRLHSQTGKEEFNTLGIPETIHTTQSILTNWLKKQGTSPRTSYVFCIELAETSEFIGLVALALGNLKYKVADMWYQIHASTLRSGYADEALKALFDFAFNSLNLHRIETDCAIYNIESIKIVEKLGMTREGKKRQFLPVDGEWNDSYMYAILQEDFELNQ